MPSSVNGVGTKYYGKRDVRADGSYLTTNFISLLFVPLIPIHSVRVVPDPKNSWLPFSTNYYMILEKRWPHPLQVLSIYLWAAAAVAMGAFYFMAMEPSLGDTWVSRVVFAGCVGIPIAAGFGVRYLLLRRAPTASE